MNTHTDQLHNTITLRNEPLRIVSLVPSQTELIVALSAQEQLVGCTKFCIHPHTVKQYCTVVGGTKNVNISKVHGLQPNLIIGNKEENVLTQIQELQHHYPVWLSDVSTYAQALAMIDGVGALINKNTQAQQLITTIQHSKLQLSINITPSVAYLMWHNPYMAVGNDTFINDMLHEAGFINALAHTTRYPIVSIVDIIAAAPNFIFLSSEPFPFKQKHLVELQQHIPNTKIIMVNGELFSWYGSRLTQAFTYFKTLRHALSIN